eukprot:TRINITY_DN9045_c0_g2_i1.p1 TRINITY_DN9045_c0_g2~~TRINITY_DN9045_c0_g2_i1.p1  ORF type:complete len:139 (-),score=23.90 TRINITY_DN9045_c0_g2_i1:50-466(-)
MYLRTLKIKFLSLPPTKRFLVFAIVALVFYAFVIFTKFTGRTPSILPNALVDNGSKLSADKPHPPPKRIKKVPLAIDRKRGPRWPDNKHDVAIVVLGYALHKDGMPQRIMKDRVDKATELYYELAKDKIHPYVILSGK